jgi:hypothetical protein
MQTTRRKLFGSLLAVIAAPFAPQLEAKDEKPEIIIRAGDPGADRLEVFNLDTGIVQNRVLSISIGRWIDVLTYVDPVSYGPNYEFPTIRVPGNWHVRQKLSLDAGA